MYANNMKIYPSTVTSKTSVLLTDFNEALTYINGFLKQNLDIKRPFYIIVVGVLFFVNVFKDSIFKLDIFGL